MINSEEGEVSVDIFVGRKDGTGAPYSLAMSAVSFESVEDTVRGNHLKEEMLHAPLVLCSL